MARRPALPTPMARLRRAALLKGILGGSRGWMVAGLVLWVPLLVRRNLGRSEKFVAREVLQPGQALRLEAIGAPTRAERRSARRAR